MKIVQVEMLAFMNGEIRNVCIEEVPENASNMDILNLVFRFGQNDIQNVPNRCSVSVGDVILLEKNRWMVIPVGFRKLTEEEYQTHKNMDRRDRSFHAYELMEK